MIEIPEPALVALVGISGSGKSTFARRHFRPTQVLSSEGFAQVHVLRGVDEIDAVTVAHRRGTGRLRSGAGRRYRLKT